MERFPPIRYPGNVPGIIYEPRAVWSIEQVNNSDTPNGRITFPRNDFQNPGKYPIILTKLLLAPVNYTYIRTVPGAPVDSLTYHVDGASALEVSEILINAPQRQNYSRRTIPLTSWPAEPRWLPTMRGVDLDGQGPQQYPSSIWGVTRWDFDHTMIIPKLGTLEIGLSPFNVATQGADPDDLREVDFAIAVSEGPPPGSDAPGRVGNWPGNARLHQRSALRYGDGFSPLRTSGAGGLGTTGKGGPTAGQQAQITDPFGALAYGPGPLTTTQQWPPDQAFTAREYDAQNASEMGSTPVTGFGVHIDQIDYDDETINATGPSVPNSPISPLAFRVAARARMRNGGSGEWWWRQGAPLALVQPSITPALVYQLPQPITLAPGDTLDVELQVQRPVVIAGNNIVQAYNVGLSFCGYAAIEG